MEEGEYLGHLTNNQAEYEGVIHALTWVHNHQKEFFTDAAEIEIRLDSDLLVNQLKGLFKIKSPGLQDLVVQAKRLERTIGIPVHYIHIPREKNKEADRLVNKALDQQMKQNRI